MRKEKPKMSAKFIFMSLRDQFKLFTIPLSIGLMYISYQKYRQVRNQQRPKQPITSPEPNLASGIELSLLKFLPLRTCSRGIGYLSSLHLPEFLRTPIYGSFCTAYDCKIQEAAVPDFKAYRTFNEFFRRALAPHHRPVAQGDDIVVSPADGTILHFEKVHHEQIEQVKGVKYSLKSFFGPLTWFNANETDDEDYHLKLHSNDPNHNYSLYQCVIYLAPGDYHRFHSPADWTVKFRRHFSGDLIGVKFANWIPGLFHINERVVYTGEWRHGFFSMTAVGATNVGTIKIYFDKFLRTNRAFWRKYLYDDKDIYDVKMKKGDPFGEFNLGSTIVLIFEAPKDFVPVKKPGDKLKYGELISLMEHASKDKDEKKN